MISINYAFRNIWVEFTYRKPTDSMNDKHLIDNYRLVSLLATYIW